jgi:hypothetical protein
MEVEQSHSLIITLQGSELYVNLVVPDGGGTMYSTKFTLKNLRIKTSTDPPVRPYEGDQMQDYQ